MEINKYNTKVRFAMSDEYVKCSKKRQSIASEIFNISKKLIAEKHTLTHEEYIRLEHQREELNRAFEDETIRLDIWDKAREICFNIADEM